MQLKVAGDYIEQFGKLAKTNNTMIIPANLADLSGVIATAMNVIKQEIIMEPISLWVVIGVALLIVEVLWVSFYSIFFGIGALVTALFIYLGLADDLTAQLLIFGVASVGSLFIFRRKLLDMFNKNAKDFKEIIDDFAKVSTPIPPHGEGKVFYRGADWIAYSDADHSLAVDSKVRIKKIDGIKLIVDPA